MSLRVFVAESILEGLAFRVQGLWLRVEGLGFLDVQGSEGFQGVEFRQSHAIRTALFWSSFRFFGRSKDSSC